MATVFGQGRVISNFALTHFNAAKHFSEKTSQIENDNADQPFGNFWEEISIYCSSSIITAAASLEALINELFISEGELHNRIQDFDTFFWGGEEIEKACFFFNRKHKITGLERKSALVKYKKAVSLMDRSPLSKKDPEYSAAGTLIGFRNHLIHFKPLWDEERRNDNLEQSLNGLFALSPFVDKGASFLEKKCMSAGCSQWAVETVVNFVTYFANKSGIDSKKLGSFK